MTNGSRPLGRLLILLVVLIGLEVAAIGVAVTTSYQSVDDRGPVAFVVEGVHAVAKVGITVAGIASKVLSVLASEAHGEEVDGASIFLPAAASTGGVYFGYTGVSEDCCGPELSHDCLEDQAVHSECEVEKNNSI